MLIHIWQQNRRLLRHLTKELVRRKQGDSDAPPDRSHDAVIVRDYFVNSPHACAYTRVMLDLTSRFTQLTLPARCRQQSL